MADADAVDVAAVLSSLKGFQRRSVDYVFERLYGASGTRRFLLADEVGLGKTHVARGVIAKAIKHLRGQGEKRIDIVYICSNTDIARQNISRLNVTGKPDFQFATRITLLPHTVRDLRNNALNFVSFTPGTSFDLGKRTGMGEERVLLYHLLHRTWPDILNSTPAKNVFQCEMSRDRFRNWLSDYDPDREIDSDLAEQFTRQLLREDELSKQQSQLTYRERLVELCKLFPFSNILIPDYARRARNELIGELRSLLAATCIEALEPDLVILDEFQRFKDLLQPDNPVGDLARHLFAWGAARVLLLSATPYKMYTLHHEAETDDHYEDFVRTVRFLFDDESRTTRMKQFLADFGRACTRVDRGGVEQLRQAKQLVEDELRRVMCRTEKLAVTADRSGMLRDVGGAHLTVTPDHVQSYLEVRSVAESLGHPDVLEYWKASPYLLNFMDGESYRLKSLLEGVAENGSSQKVVGALSEAASCLLNSTTWQAYGDVEPRHSLLDHVASQTIGAGWWRLLWVPPSFPYHELTGAFGQVERGSVTKRLVFSSWNVVPRAISVLMSYAAERQMMMLHDPAAVNTTEARERRRPLLTFTRSEGRLTGMPVLALLYPSLALAKLGDPLATALTEPDHRQPTLEAVLAVVAARMQEALAPHLDRAPTAGPEDETWYWAAPLMLDRDHDRVVTEAWFANSEELASEWSGGTEEGAAWVDHVRQAAEVARGRLVPPGRPPGDLIEVLAYLAVAGPANCGLRALLRTVAGPHLSDDPQIRHAAGIIGWGFRSLFNIPEVTALIRGLNRDEPYWRRVLEYAAGGCLQSVLDEYLHLLVELEGLTDRPPRETASDLASAVAARVGLRAATPGVDWIRVEDPGAITIENQRSRARFAMRFGDEHGEQEVDALRKDAVRAAFNSPFWPFVLATTSIGQEGLDFHCYCHAVVHWNLPSNPVDMEQREGRVHRYKGHAVRKNVARFAQTAGLRPDAAADPWHELFRYAAEQAAQDSEIHPYWVFPVEHGSVIERHAPTLPLSREAARLPLLRSSLAVYRMVFGQPRQDDLVEHLKRTVPEAELTRLARELSVNLEPRSSGGESWP